MINLILKTSNGFERLNKGDKFVPKSFESIQELILKGHVVLLSEEAADDIEISYWLEKLSAAEREIFINRTAAMKGTSLHKEHQEIDLIKFIIAERIILGKCDVCPRVDICMLNIDQRHMCEVSTPNPDNKNK